MSARLLAAAAGADDEPTARLAYLQPGGVLAFSEPTVVTASLGSGVAIALCDAQAGVGGVNHFELADASTGDRSSCRYAEPACEQLLARVLALGARPERLRARVFGGAGVGSANVSAARRWLATQGIPVAGAHVGGRLGRSVFIEIPGGEARVLVIDEGEPESWTEPSRTRTSCAT
jgi:chemotaxis protein CheD